MLARVALAVILGWTSLVHAGALGGGGGHIIQDEGVDRNPTTKLNFTGSGVTASAPTGQTQNVTISGAAGGPPAFNDITSATNSAAAMVVGTGASIGVSGSGTVTATGASANPANCSAGQCAGGVGANWAAESCIDPIVATEIDTSAEVAAIVTDETGTGAMCFATSPVIVTPTIGNFTNAQHNHQTDTAGGRLDTSAIATGRLPIANGGTGNDSFTAGSGVCVSDDGLSFVSSPGACGSGSGSGSPSVGSADHIQASDGLGHFRDTNCTGSAGAIQCPCAGTTADPCLVGLPANTQHPNAPTSGCIFYAFSDRCIYTKCVGDPSGAGALIACSATTTSTTSTSSTSVSTSSSTSSTSSTSTTSTSTSSTTTSTVSGGTFAPVDWTSSMVAVYKMEESATPWANSGGCGSNCNLAGGSGTQSSTHQEGSFSVSFDGATQSLTCGASSCAAITTGLADNLTIAMWLIPATGNANGANAFHDNDFSNTGGLQLNYQSSTSVYQWQTWNGATANTCTSAAGDTPLDNFRHVVFTANGTAMTDVVNGFQSNACTKAGTAYAPPGAQAFQLSPSFNRWTGFEDELVIDDIAWTTTQGCRVARCGIAGEMCACQGSNHANYLTCSNNSDCRSISAVALCNPATNTCSGRTVGECAAGANSGKACNSDSDCPSSTCTQCTIPACDVAAP